MNSKDVLRRLLLALALLLAFSGLAEAKVYSVADVPNPRAKASPGGFVTDEANLLGPAKAVIEARFAELEKKSGTEVALVILPSIGEAVPKHFATALFARFGIGKKGKDSGLLILHVLDQKRLELETGYGLEGVLPDAKCSWLVTDLAIPEFKAARFASGHERLSRGVVYLLGHPEGGHQQLLAAVPADNAFANVEAPKSPAEPERSVWEILAARPRPSLGHIAPAVLILVLGSFRNRSHKRHFPKKGRRPSLGTIGVGPGVVILWFISVIVAFCVDGKWVLHAGTAIVVIGGFFVLRETWRAARGASERERLRPCPECEKRTFRLRDVNDQKYLSKLQRIEQRLGAYDYDVWLCPEGHTQILRFPGHCEVPKCPQCGNSTLEETSETKKPRTRTEEGLAHDTKKCEVCGFFEEHDVILPKRSSSTSSSSSSSGSSFGGGSSSSSGGSFGGGRSGGGGSGGSY